jgi:hypothetical protein
MQKVTKKSRLQKNGGKLLRKPVAAELASGLPLRCRGCGLEQRRLPISLREKDGLHRNFLGAIFLRPIDKTFTGQ